MKRFFILSISFFLLSIISVQGKFVRVGLYLNTSSSKYVFIAANSDYSIAADKSRKITIKVGESVTLELKGNFVALKFKGDTIIGRYSRIKCTPVDSNGFFRLKSKRPEAEAWPFNDMLEVSASKGKLRIVNIVDLEKYVAGVVESEIGDNSNEEFVKVQAVMCRTYVLGHLKRHAREGFEVCDRVHCQVFHAKSRFNNAILKAVEETRGEVLVDSLGTLITGAFHSNCGGCTSGAKDAWSTDMSYLKSVTDTFCLHSLHATWQQKIQRQAWIDYLRKKDVEITDSLLTDSSFVLMQPNRQVNYVIGDKAIPLKMIRNDFNLKSTWFNIFPQGDSLLFQGFGYGHGVGLCQEGAMKMAEYNYKMQDIINFYFKDVSVLDYSSVKLSKRK